MNILMYMLPFIFLLTSVFSHEIFAENFLDFDLPEKPMVVVIPSYNNVNWYENNLTSVISQKYSNFRVIYLNDASTDGLGEAIEQFVKNKNLDYYCIDFDDEEYVDIPNITGKFVKEVNEERHFITIVNNVNRCGALENLYRAIHSCDDKEIIVTVDGDDWFAHTNVLNKLNALYSNSGVWLTHGFMKEYPHGGTGWSIPIPHNIIENNAFREYRCPSHLRTFYVWLFKQIDLDDLLYEGKFFPMTWDMAIMFPMIEMAGERHAFINEVSYIYNMANQLNDNKVNPKLQNNLDYLIRHMKRYQKLDEAPF